MSQRLPRTAIPVGGRLLTVPAMHPNTPSAVRVQVFELVLRRLYGEAVELAAATNDKISRRSPERARLAVVVSMTPHRDTPRAVAA